VDTDPVSTNSLIDDVYGDLTFVHDAITATDCTAGLITQSGDSYICTFMITVPDLSLENLTTTVTVTGTDDEGNQALASDKTTLILDFLSIYLPIVFK
jgi:hypothetical protein